MKELTIDPQFYLSKDIEAISDILVEILAEDYEILVESLGFEIKVYYHEDEEME